MIPAIEFVLPIKRNEMEEAKETGERCISEMSELPKFLIGLVDVDDYAENSVKVTAYFGTALAMRNAAGEVVNATDKVVAEFAEKVSPHLPANWRYVAVPELMIEHGEVLGYVMPPKIDEDAGETVVGEADKV